MLYLEVNKIEQKMYINWLVLFITNPNYYGNSYC